MIAWLASAGANDPPPIVDHWYAVLAGLALLVTAFGTLANRRGIGKVNKAVNNVEPGTPPLVERVAKLEAVQTANHEENRVALREIRDSLHTMTAALGQLQERNRGVDGR